MAYKKYLDYDGLVEVVNKIYEKFAPIQAFIFKGTVSTVANLPSLGSVEVGWVYSIQQEGTTTADFVEGAGLHINPNSEVIAVNVGTSSQPTMKWSVLGNLFDLSDKLTFGDTMPVSPSDGDTFLYMGETSYVFTEVTPVGDEDPAELGWYEKNQNDVYVLTEDTVVDNEKEYFVRNEQYIKGVIYVYDSLARKWIPQTSGDIFVPITNSEIDNLFE